MSVLLPLLLLLGTEVLECPRGTVERCHEAGSGGWGRGRGRWVLVVLIRRNHVLTLSRIVGLAATASVTSSNVL